MTTHNLHAYPSSSSHDTHCETSTRMCRLPSSDIAPWADLVTYHGASPVASSDGVSNLLSQIAQTPEELFLLQRGRFRQRYTSGQSLPLHRRYFP